MKGPTKHEPNLQGSSEKRKAKFKLDSNDNLERVKLDIQVEEKIDLEKKDRKGMTLLMHCASTGKLEGLNALIKAGANINAKDNDGISVLTYAAALPNNDECVHRLIEAGVDIDAKDNEDKTALMHCAIAGNISSLNLLINLKANINEVDEDDMTALMYSAHFGKHECLDSLIKAGADINAKDTDGLNVLMHAATVEEKKCIQIILKENIDLELKDNHGRTALFYSAEVEDVVSNLVMRKLQAKRKDRGLCLLIEAGANVNAIDNERRSALMYAAEQNLVCCELLIENGADINATDLSGTNALMYAAYSKNKNAFEFLINKGAACTDNAKLISVIMRGGEKFLEKLINIKAVKDLTDDKGKTLPMYAAINENEKVLELLIKKGIKDIDAQAKNGMSALMYAAMNENEKVLELLIESGVKHINAQTEDGMNALMYAAMNENEKVLELLIKEGVKDIDAQAKNGMSALMYAARNRNEKVLRLLIKEDVKGINAQAEDGMNALICAAMNENEKVLELLINAGVKDIDAQTEDGMSALMYAAMNKNEKVLESLINAGVKGINAQAKDGMNALMCAAMNENEKVLELLINAGVKGINAQSKDGMNALMCAAMNENEKVLELLINAGVKDIDAQSKDGMSASMYAARNKNEKVLELLIEKGVDINAQAKDGMNVLMCAAINENEVILEKLINSGAKLDIKDNKDRMVSMYAAHNKNEKVLKLLIDKEVQLDSKDKEGLTVLMHAAMNSSKDIFKMLIDCGASNNPIQSIAEVSCYKSTSDAVIKFGKEYYDHLFVKGNKVDIIDAECHENIEELLYSGLQTQDEDGLILNHINIDLIISYAKLLYGKSTILNEKMMKGMVGLLEGVIFIRADYIKEDFKNDIINKLGDNAKDQEMEVLLDEDDTNSLDDCLLLEYLYRTHVSKEVKSEYEKNGRYGQKNSNELFGIYALFVEMKDKDEYDQLILQFNLYKFSLNILTTDIYRKKRYEFAKRYVVEKFSSWFKIAYQEIENYKIKLPAEIIEAILLNTPFIYYKDGWIKTENPENKKEEFSIRVKKSLANNEGEELAMSLKKDVIKEIRGNIESEEQSKGVEVN